MTLKELRERIEVYSNERYDDLEVCIPNNKGGMMGGTPVTSVKGANKGIDWDGGKFFIWPETEMVEMKKLPDDDKLYSEIEQEIIRWSNDGTQTAGTLTRTIMKLLNK